MATLGAASVIVNCSWPRSECRYGWFHCSWWVSGRAEEEIHILGGTLLGLISRRLPEAHKRNPHNRETIIGVARKFPPSDIHQLVSFLPAPNSTAKPTAMRQAEFANSTSEKGQTPARWRRLNDDGSRTYIIIFHSCVFIVYTPRV